MPTDNAGNLNSENLVYYRAFLDRAREGIWAMDRDLRTTFVNPKICELLGYSADEMMGRNVEEFLPPEDMETHRVRMAQRKAGEDERYEQYFVRGDGRRVLCQVSASAMQDDTGEFDGSFALCFDITQRREAERAAANSADQMRDILESISDAFFSLDENLVVTYWNAAAEKGLGVSRDEVVGRKLFDVFAEARGTEFERQYKAALADRQFREFETYFEAEPYRDWFAVRVYPNHRGLSVFFQVVTERKKTEEKLRQSERFLKSIFESIQDGMSVIDRDLNIVHVNSKMEAWFGASEELVGRKCYDVYHPAEGAGSCDGCPALRCFESGETAKQTKTLETNDGVTTHIELSCYPVTDPDTGEVTSAVEFIRDISDRVRAEEERAKFEEEMRYAQKLESLGVLAGGIAHDFNNLLMAILGNLDLALGDLSPVSPIRENLVEAERASRRAADLCRQMLAYSGRGKFLVQDVSLPELIEQAQHMLEISVSKNTVLRYHLADEVPMVAADASQVRQILMNLVLNGSEALEEKSGLVSIATGVMDCDREYLADTYVSEDIPAGHYVFLEVSDTGCGMDREMLEKIFDPFFTTKFTGRGLGLAAVLGIVRGHQGAIKVYTEEGRGTSIKVLFPVDASKAAEDSSVVDSCDWSGGGKILLVDDEEAVLRVGKRMLERLGFGVETACDGRRALEVYQEHEGEFVCVLLDMTMPHQNGEETYRELRKVGARMPVVISSGYNEQEVTQRFMGKGLAGFIQKPYRLDLLRSTLQDVLES